MSGIMEGKYSLKSIPDGPNRDEQIELLNKTLAGLKWPFTVKALNKNQDAKVVSATLSHLQFEE